MKCVGRSELGNAAGDRPRGRRARRACGGRHLAGGVVGCTACHGATLGGAPLINDPATVVLWAPNLTRGRGGFLATNGATAFERALRHGIGPDGKKLMVMPSWDYAALSSADLASLLAYVRSLPPVARRTPAVELGPKGAAAIRSGELSYDADRLAKEAVPRLDSSSADGAAYGGYLARVAGCESCHGEHLAGTPGGAPPHAPNLTPRALCTWTAATFVTAIRTGRVPGGGKLDPEVFEDGAVAREGNVGPGRERLRRATDSARSEVMRS